MATIKIEKGIPYQKNNTTEIIDVIRKMSPGDSVYLLYNVFNKTEVKNAVASARIRVIKLGLCLKVNSDFSGMRVWAFKRKKADN